MVTFLNRREEGQGGISGRGSRIGSAFHVLGLKHHCTHATLSYTPGKGAIPFPAGSYFSVNYSKRTNFHTKLLKVAKSKLR